MSISFSVATMTSIIGSEMRSLNSRRFDVVRTEVMVAPKQRKESIFYPQLSKQSVALADLHVQEVVER